MPRVAAGKTSTTTKAFPDDSLAAGLLGPPWERPPPRRERAASGEALVDDWVARAPPGWAPGREALGVAPAPASSAPLVLSEPPPQMGWHAELDVPDELMAKLKKALEPRGGKRIKKPKASPEPPVLARMRKKARDDAARENAKPVVVNDEPPSRMRASHAGLTDGTAAAAAREPNTTCRRSGTSVRSNEDGHDALGGQPGRKTPEMCITLSHRPSVGVGSPCAFSTSGRCSSDAATCPPDE